MARGNSAMHPCDVEASPSLEFYCGVVADTDADVDDVVAADADVDVGAVGDVDVVPWGGAVHVADVDDEVAVGCASYKYQFDEKDTSGTFLCRGWWAQNWKPQHNNKISPKFQAAMIASSHTSIARSCSREFVCCCNGSMTVLRCEL